LLFFLVLVFAFGAGNIALATCYDSGGDCYDVEGAKWFRKFCKDDTTAVEYSCSVTTSKCEPTEIPCGAHYTCSGGECKKEKYCSDTDYYKDIYKLGSCREYNPSEGPFYDTCDATGTELTEYYCASNGECKPFTFNCSSIGASCSGGHCSGGPSLFSCYDSDGGIKANIAGRCTDHYDDFYDNCNIATGKLTEYFCEEELHRCVPKTINCSAGCDGNDKCAGAAVSIEPSKPTGANECCRLNHKLTDVDSACDKGVVVGPNNPQQCDLNGDGEADTIDGETIKWGTCCFLDSIYNVSDWMFYIVLSIAVIFGVISGFMFMTSGGDPAKTQKARNLLIYMAIGLVVVALSKVIPAIIKAIIT
jgi:hypothetical protein